MGPSWGRQCGADAQRFELGRPALGDFQTGGEVQPAVGDALL